jgi:hypothetical protein
VNGLRQALPERRIQNPKSHTENCCQGIHPVDLSFVRAIGQWRAENLLSNPHDIRPFCISKPTVSDAHLRHLPVLDVPERLLLGPGPSNADPAVVAAMNRQPIGHLDPAYLAPDG